MQDEKIATIKSWLGTGSINVFGLPLSGKDTQCKMLAEMLHAEFISSGEVLRNNWDGQKDVGGDLTPKNIFFDIILPYLSSPALSGKPLILSSIGRWHGEETAVVETLAKSEHDLRAVIYLDISEEDSFKRLKFGAFESRGSRPDDTEEALSIRLKEYQEKTMPVIDYYRQQRLLISVDGRPIREEIFENIIDKLYKKATAKND